MRYLLYAHAAQAASKINFRYAHDRRSYKFTAKEMDEARTIAGVSCVGLYYYGARYLDAKYSRWMSTDPAVGEYVSKDYAGNSGGIYNSVNFNLYHYANNNPVKYIDPDGKDTASAVIAAMAIDFAVPEPSDVLIVQKAIIYGVAIAGALAFDYIQRKKAEKILAEVENTQKNNSTSEAADKARENLEGNVQAPTEGIILPDSPDVLGHIFDPDKGGHVEDTPENRDKLRDTANDPDSYLGQDKYGNDWHARTNDDGSQTWTVSRNGRIWDGGVNKQPKGWNPDTGLKSPDPLQ